MDYTCKETLIENLKDCGCDKDTIHRFMACFESGDCAGKMKILEEYREKLLDQLHKKQKEIDLLDYMVYMLDKCQCKG